MSELRRQLSFRLVRAGRAANEAPFSQHQWPFDAHDFAAMHGKVPRLLEMGGVQGVAGALRTHPKLGLYQDELATGDLSVRRKLFGVNRIEKEPLKTFWEHAREIITDPMLLILMAAGAVSFSVGLATDPGHGWTEGIAIVLAVFLVTTVGALSNMKQEREFRRMDEANKENQYQVMRGGEAKVVSESQIVTGDIIDLTPGAYVPADGLYVVGDGVAVNESQMTGEQKDIHKDSKRPFMLSGTELKKGQTMMLATAVGPNSYYGRILDSLQRPIEATPLQRKLARVAKLMGYIGGGTAVVLFFTLLTFWTVDVIKNDKAFVDEVGHILDFFIIAVTLVVVAIPEGLPLAVTISLAYSMKKMQRDQNLVRVLSACETMGNATTICSDKTGTLTQNRMTVMEGWLAGAFFERLQDAPALPAFATPLLVNAVVVNSTAKFQRVSDSDQRQVWVGNQTEVALLEWMTKYGHDVERCRDAVVVLRNYPFDAAKKNSSVIVRAPPDAPRGTRFRRFFKGAGEQLFARSQRVLDARGSEAELEAGSGAHKEVADAIARMARTGLRTIGFAYQDYGHIDVDPLDPGKLVDPVEDPPMVFVGVVGIKDPLRPEARASVRECQRAGVIVRMVTGDMKETAEFIARECGIITSPKHVALTGDEFRVLVQNKEEAERVIPWLRVLARSLPEDKETLVRWLKEHGEVVAATGDGTNDAPALKEAHVGLAMNIVGTAVAKAAAKILILDDNFSSIVKSIMWGRCVYDNIRKFLQFQLTINVVALAITLIGAFSGYENPLRPVQLLWVNLIMDTLAALALGTEEPNNLLLRRRPYQRDARLISPIMWRNILGQAAFQLTALMFILFAGNDVFGIEKRGPEVDERDRNRELFTLVFNTFVWMQLFNEINSRKVNNEMNVFASFFTNYIFWLIMAVTVLMQVVMVQVLGDFADTTAQNGAEWGYA